MMEEEKRVELGMAVMSEVDSPERKVVSITEAAKINNVTRQAIYVAIKQNKLKATKKSRWEIELKDLEEYRRNKYSRTKSMYQGELLFDNQQGYYSVKQVSKMLEIPSQKVYYALRTGMLKSSRKGAAWVIHLNDVNHYRDTYIDRRATRVQQAS